MQMIDVLKRLQELDAKNPNIVKEEEISLKDFFSNLRNQVEKGINVVDTFHDNIDQLPVELPDKVIEFLRDQSAEADGVQDEPEKMKSIMLAAIDKVESILGLHNNMKRPMAESLEECGMMGDMNKPHSPATINMTADSGEELAHMLKDIMSLSGMRKVEPTDLGIEPEPAVMRADPSLGKASDNDDMRRMLDTLNDEEVTEMDNEPTDEIMGNMKDDAMLSGKHNHYQSGGPEAAEGRAQANNPHAYPNESAAYESLMADYRKFVNESQEQDVEEGIVDKTKLIIDKIKRLFGGKPPVAEPDLSKMSLPELIRLYNQELTARMEKRREEEEEEKNKPRMPSPDGNHPYYDPDYWKTENLPDYAKINAANAAAKSKVTSEGDSIEKSDDDLLNMVADKLVGDLETAKDIGPLVDYWADGLKDVLMQKFTGNSRGWT